MEIVREAIAYNLSILSVKEIALYSFPQMLIMYAMCAALFERNPAQAWKPILIATTISMPIVAVFGQGVTFAVALIAFIIISKFTFGVSWFAAIVSWLPNMALNLIAGTVLEKVYSWLGYDFLYIDHDSLAFLCGFFISQFVLALLVWVTYRYKMEFAAKWAIIKSADKFLASSNLLILLMQVGLGIILFYTMDVQVLDDMPLTFIQITTALFFLTAMYKTYSMFRIVPIIQRNTELEQERELLDSVQHFNYLIRSDFQERLANYEALMDTHRRGDYERMGRILSDVAGSLEKVRGALIHADHPVLQTMLWSLKQQAARLGVTLEIEGKLEMPQSLSVMNLVAIVGNLTLAAASAVAECDTDKTLFVQFERKPRSVEIGFRHAGHTPIKVDALQITNEQPARPVPDVVYLKSLIERAGGDSMAFHDQEKGSSFIVSIPA